MLRTQCFLFLVVFALSDCAQGGRRADGCTRHLRALMDVGSGSTKLNLSEVSTCDDQIHLVRVLDDQTSVKVSLEGDKARGGELSAESQQTAVKALADLRDKAMLIARAEAPDFKEIEFAAVGTHAFRTATNSAELAARVRPLGFDLVALPQEKEGEYGYEGVKLKGTPEACQARALVVWDVGGGSMQLTARGPKGDLNVQKISFGAESFKQRMIARQAKSALSTACAVQEPTPNPIGWKNATQAQKTAEQMAANALAPSFELPGACVVGIGAVHGKAIEAQIRKLWSQIQGCVCGASLACKHAEDSYSKKELQCLGLYLADKNDCDPAIQGPYSPTAVSNVFLILGFMERLKINQVHTMNVNMGTNLVTDNTVLHWRRLAIK